MVNLRTIEKYVPFIEEEDFKGSLAKFNPKNFTKCKEYLRFILKHWDEIIEIGPELPLIFQNILSFLLRIYYQTSYLDEMSKKINTIEIFSNYLYLFSRQGKSGRVKKIIKQYDHNDAKGQKILALVDLKISITLYYIEQLEYERANHTIKSIQDILQKIDPEDTRFKTAINEYNVSINLLKATFYGKLKEYETAIDYAKLALMLLNKAKSENYYLLAMTNMTLGNLYQKIGDLKTQNYFDQAHKYFELLGDERGLAVINANAGLIGLREGRFEEALTFLIEFIDLMEKKKDHRNIVITCLDIYSAYKSLGNFQKAEYYLNKAWKIVKQNNLINNNLYLVSAEFYALKGDLEKAKENLEQYKDNLRITEEKRSIALATYKIYEGLIELKSQNVYNAEKNVRIGYKIAKSKNNSILVLQALIYLIELSLIKYRIEDDEDIKNSIMYELELFCEETVILLKTHQSIFQQINYALLLANVYILSHKLDLALSVLQRTENLCSTYNLTHQCEEVRNTIQLVNTLERTNIGDNLIKDTSTIIDQFIISMVNYSTKGITDAKYMIEGEIKPDIYYILILTPSGLPFYSKTIKEESIRESDDLLLAGLIKAIQNFSSELEFTKGMFRMLEHSDYTVLIETRQEFTTVIFSDSFSYPLKAAIQQLCDKLESEVSEIEMEYEESGREKVENKQASEIVEELLKTTLKEFIS